MGVRNYATPAAFRAALDSRMLQRARNAGRPVSKVRTMVAMERFLVRVQQVLPPTVMLKGGLALELRLQRARTTRDIDLRLMGSPERISTLLDQAAALTFDPDDHMRFNVSSDPHHPTIEGDGIVYQGFRYRVVCTIAARPFGDPFGLDVAYGDVVYGEPVEVVIGDALEFAGIAPAKFRIYPPETHIAEKLHAYSLPRQNPNSRVKDLPDIALIGTLHGLSAQEVRNAIQATFTFRDTHEAPSTVPAPPDFWSDRYRRIAEQEALPWRELPAVLAAVTAFMDPVLKGQNGVWDPDTWTWCRDD